MPSHKETFKKTSLPFPIAKYRQITTSDNEHSSQSRLHHSANVIEFQLEITLNVCRNGSSPIHQICRNSEDACCRHIDGHTRTFSHNPHVVSRRATLTPNAPIGTVRPVQLAPDPNLDRCRVGEGFGASMLNECTPVFIGKSTFEYCRWKWVAGVWLAEGRWDGDVPWDPRSIRGFCVAVISVDVIYRS
jgi:hypothetical protein